MHELTEKVTDVVTFGNFNTTIDKIITDWLKSKAEQLSVLESNTPYSNKFFYQILSLKEKTLEEKFSVHELNRKAFRCTTDGGYLSDRVCIELAQIAKEHFKP